LFFLLLPYYYFCRQNLRKTHKNEVNESIWYLYMDNKLQAEFTSAAFLVWLGAKKTLQ